MIALPSPPRFRVLRPLLALAILLVLPAEPAPVGATPTVEVMEWLGWPDAIRSVSYVTVNDSGRVALTAATETWRTQAFVRVQDEWGGLLSWESSAETINNFGIVSGWRTTSDTGGSHGYFWSPLGGFVTTEGVEPAGTSFVRAAATDDDGTMVGRICLEQSGSTVCWPFRWDDAGFAVLEGTVSNGEPMALNAVGRMVVRAFEGSGNAIYLIDPDDTVTPLPPAPWDLANPLDLNSLGQIVGDAETSTGSTDDAFVWDGASYVVLPRPVGFSSADAHGINDLGQIAGWGWDGGFGAIVWENGEAFDLSALVQQQLGMAVDLKKATAISETGWVVGWGTNPATGGPEIFRARLARPCVDLVTGTDMVAWVAGDGLYTDGDNWSTASVPTAEEVVRFDERGGGIVTFDGSATNRALVVRGGPGAFLDLGEGTWRLQGGDPCLASLVTRAGDGELGLLDFSGGTLLLDQGADLAHDRETIVSVLDGQSWAVSGGPFLAGHPDTTVVSFGAGTSLDVSSETVLGLRGGTRGRLVFEGASLRASDVVLGSAGGGELDVVSSQLTADRLVLGESAAGSGLASFRGDAGTFVTVDQDVLVGAAGAGLMSLRRSVFGAGRLVVGVEPGAEGLVSVEGEAEIFSDDVIVGDVGAGTLEIVDGGRLSQSTDPASRGWVTVGGGAGGVGSLDLRGDLSSARLGGLTVGDQGTGSLDLRDGAGVSVEASLLVGDGPGGTGTVDVARGILQTGAIYVGTGEGATGRVTVDSTAIVTTSLLHVGAGGEVQGPVLAMERVDAPRRAPTGGGVLRTATLELGDGAVLDVADVRFGTGWTLAGAGSFPFDLTNEARVAPGTDLAPGTLVVDGDYTQRAGGVLHVDVFAPEDLPVGTRARTTERADLLAVSGNATLGGVLEIAFAPDHEPAEGDTITVVRCAAGAPALVGAFDEVRAPAGIRIELIEDVGEVRAVIEQVGVGAWTLGLGLVWEEGVPRLTLDPGFDPRGGWFELEVRPSSGAWTPIERVRAADLPAVSGRWHWTIDPARLEGFAARDEPVRIRVAWSDEDGRRVTSPSRILERSAFVSASRLSRVTPNPFNPRASFTLQVERDGLVRIRVLDLRGRLVATVFEGRLDAGPLHEFRLGGEGWASGIYLLTVDAPGVRATRKLTLVR